MVSHIVIFSWKPGTSPQQVEALRHALDRMVAGIPDLVSIEHGPDLRFRDGNGDYALVASFPDRAGWDAYQSDPRHKEFIRDHVTPIQASRVAIQISGGPPRGATTKPDRASVSPTRASSRCSSARRRPMRIGPSSSARASRF